MQIILQKVNYKICDDIGRKIDFSYKTNALKSCSNKIANFLKTTKGFPC